MPYIGKSPGKLGVRTRYHYTATGSETSKSGPDDNGLTLKFDDGEYVDVYLNGSLLVAGSDYNTATANTISGLTALASNDILEVVVYDIYSLAKVNSEAQRTVYHKTASGGETSISGTDDGGATITFPANATIDVYLNGVKLKQGADYNTTTANTVGGLTALTAGQLVAITVYEKFVAADMVKKSGDTMTGGLSAPSITSTGGVSGTTGTFSSNVGMQGLTATTGSFSGDLTVDRGTTHASAIVKGGNATTNYSGGSLLLANPGMATNYGGTYLYHHKAGGSGNTNAAFNISQRNASGGYVSNIWNVDYQNNAHSFYVPNGGISGAVALGIDGSGRVTTPSQPSFLARCDTNASTVSNPIPFNVAVLNIGGHYSTSTYRFTAPIGGSYYLSYSIRVNNNTGGHIIHPSFVINGAQDATSLTIHRNDVGGAYLHTSFSYIKYLAAGDHVVVSNANASNAGSIQSGQTMFSGFLLG